MDGHVPLDKWVAGKNLKFRGGQNTVRNNAQCFQHMKSCPGRARLGCPLGLSRLVYNNRVFLQ